MKLCRAGVPVTAFGAAGPPDSNVPAVGGGGSGGGRDATVYELVGSAS